jgi:hypothetical protein
VRHSTVYRGRRVLVQLSGPKCRLLCCMTLRFHPDIHIMSGVTQQWGAPVTPLQLPWRRVEDLITPVFNLPKAPNRILTEWLAKMNAGRRYWRFIGLLGQWIRVTTIFPDGQWMRATAVTWRSHQPQDSPSTSCSTTRESNTTSECPWMNDQLMSS